MTELEEILIAILGGGNLLLFIEFLISRHDKKKEDEMLTIKRDGIRTQLLVLIFMSPDDTAEILRVAERYFKDLDGDWYMTPIFYRYLKEHNVAEPEWFNKGGTNNE